MPAVSVSGKIIPDESNVRGQGAAVQIGFRSHVPGFSALQKLPALGRRGFVLSNAKVPFAGISAVKARGVQSPAQQKRRVRQLMGTAAVLVDIRAHACNRRVEPRIQRRTGGSADRGVGIRIGKAETIRRERIQRGSPARRSRIHVVHGIQAVLVCHDQDHVVSHSGITSHIPVCS